MSEQFLERIITDAKTEAKNIVKQAKQLATSNIAYAKIQAQRNEEMAIKQSKQISARDRERADAAEQVERQKQTLIRKTEIVDKVFESVKGKVTITQKVINKYKKSGDIVKQTKGGVLIENKNYQINLTLDELVNSMREDIESNVAEILFT